ncbi:M23 family metallopeptidase [Aminipila sp.]|uniref:M23 family metallopeptidase n=1 Tax=Aminipila sp. TaxID=2060095 RepID=UPI00289DEA5B|nr:M23 family metallopeptidase [Aminipila sp.]
MENNRKRPKKKKKIVKRAVIVIGIPVLIIIIAFSAMLTILASFMPSAAVSMVDDYKKAAELAGCTWQELVVYDTVRFHNDLEDVNPYLSAVDFMKMYYEIYKYVETEDGGYWTLVSSGTLITPESIWRWLRIPKDSDINAVLEAAGKYARPEFVVQFSPKELDDLIIEKKFTEEQIEWVDMLMTSGALDEMFGDVHDLPDYIDSAGTGYFGWPAPALHNITSKFAVARKHPVFGITRAHNGVDISGPGAMGSPVCAIDDGVVISVNLNGGERGINVRVQHNIGDDVWVSRYQHLSAAKATVGQKVTKGTVIGAVGNSGIGTGPHLHLELTYNGVLIDPLPLIK